jgi:hypothetical protein
MLRTATCRAIQYSDVFCLHYDDLHAILQEYPEVLESITKATLEKLETMQGINEQTKQHIKRKSMTRRFSLKLGSNIHFNNSNRSINKTNIEKTSDADVNEINLLDDLEIDSSIIDDINEDYERRTKNSNGDVPNVLTSNKKSKKTSRRVSVSAKTADARLGKTGTLLMRAYSNVASNDEVDENFKEEYTRQKTWSLAKKWHSKSHSMEYDNDDRNDNNYNNSGNKNLDNNYYDTVKKTTTSSAENKISERKKRAVLFNGNDLLKQRRLLKKNGPIDLRDHLATLFDPDHVNYLVQHRNKEVEKDKNIEIELRKRLLLAKQIRKNHTERRTNMG